MAALFPSAQRRMISARRKSLCAVVAARRRRSNSHRCSVDNSTCAAGRPRRAMRARGSHCRGLVDPPSHLNLEPSHVGAFRVVQPGAGPGPGAASGTVIGYGAASRHGTGRPPYPRAALPSPVPVPDHRSRTRSRSRTRPLFGARPAVRQRHAFFRRDWRIRPLGLEQALFSRRVRIRQP